MKNYDRFPVRCHMAQRPILALVRRKRLLIGSAIVLVLGSFVMARPDLRSALNTNEGAVSGLLTLMLVLVYVGQYHLLDRQLSLENRPHLVLEERDEEGNEIHAWLSNLGNGVATDIELETKIDFEGDGTYSPSSGRMWMRRVGDEGDKKKRIGNSLEAGRNYEKFIGRAITGLLVDGEYQKMGLRAATGDLAMDDVDVETATVEFSIVNSDLLGNEYSEPVHGVPYKIDLDRGDCSAEEVIIHGRSVAPGWDDA